MIGNIPSFRSFVINTQNTFNREWYNFLSSIFTTYKNYTNKIKPLNVTSSPFVYKNETGSDVELSIVGGDVFSIKLMRNIDIELGQSKIVRLSPNDSVKITYSIAPVCNVIPR
jgi:hypothetical protein